MENNIEKITALLEHLAHHNEHHAEEIMDLGPTLRQLGKEEAAALVEEGAKTMDEANAKLRKALEALK